MEIVSAIDTSINLAKELYKLIDKFIEAPENARAHLLNSQLSIIRLDLLQTLVKDIYRNLDDVQRRRVAAAVRDLNQDLRNAIMYLENKAPNDVISRMRWAIWTGNGVIKLFDDIESRFSVLQSLLDLARQHPILASLDKDHFKITTKYPDYKYLHWIIGSSYFVEADLIAPDRSNINRTRPPINVFVESYRIKDKATNESNTIQYQEAHKAAQFVAERLWWTHVSGNAAKVPYQAGVLPCIGYNEYRVVFLLPSNAILDKPQTLRDCIMANPRVSLETRLSFALQLAEAVFQLHLAGLAHRSIRSNLILFLKPKEEDNANGMAGGQNRAEDASRRAAQSRDPDESPRPGLRNRLARTFNYKKDKPALKDPSKALRQTPSRTSMRKDKLSGMERFGIHLWKGASKDRDLDLLDKATADQDQGATPSSRSRRPLGNSAMTPRCGKIPPGFGSLYLTGWISANYSGAYHQPRTEKRARDIYMHPELRENTAFYMGHDIYSLGVCLVEVGVWDLFVHEEEPTQSATTYGKLAYRADVKNRGVDLETVKKRIVDLASKELPASIGEGYAELVNTCLTCLDPTGPWKGVGPEDFCERFRNDVLLPLRSIVVGFSSWRRLEPNSVR